MAHARKLSYTQDSTLRPFPSLTVIRTAHALQIKVKSEALWQGFVSVQGDTSGDRLFDALEQHLSTSVLPTSVPVVLSCCTSVADWTVAAAEQTRKQLLDKLLQEPSLTAAMSAGGRRW